MMFFRKTQTKPRATYPYFSFKDLLYFLTASKFDFQWPRVGDKTQTSCQTNKINNTFRTILDHLIARPTFPFEPFQ